jgi:hypothetical protein
MIVVAVSGKHLPIPLRGMKVAAGMRIGKGKTFLSPRSSGLQKFAIDLAALSYHSRASGG